MAITAAVPDLDRLRPAGTKRSSKRDLIVNVFLKQEGHLSADDLVDLIQTRGSSHQPRDRLPHPAVDGRRGHRPQGRFRRGPVSLRAFLPAPAALPSDLQDLQPLVRIPQLRHRGARRRGRRRARGSRRGRAWCRSMAPAKPCSTGRAPDEEPANSELLFARDALRIAIATERSGMEFYGRGVKLVKDPRAREVFRKLATEEVHHLKTLEGRYQNLLKQDPRRRGRRSCFSRARPTACSRPAASSCAATASTISRRIASAFAASAARTGSSSGTASGSKTPKASRCFSSSPTRSASISSC